MTKPAKTTAPEPTETGPGVVLFGLDSSGKPIAARFPAHHADRAGKAAELKATGRRGPRRTGEP